MTIRSSHDIILDPWEQALEESESMTLGVDPYGLMGLAKTARYSGDIYVSIPLSRDALSRINERAEQQNKTTTMYMRDLMEHA